jgi:hypothetical protein
VVLSREANECFNTLSQKATCSKLERGLVKAILAKAELIKANPHYGQPISKKLIPKEWKTRLGVNNLFRVQLPQFWRRLYSLSSGGKNEVITFVHSISSHEKYDEILGY